MTFGIFEIFKILGALGLFIYGMKVMSEGIQRAAGSQLRSILRSLTRNRFFSLLTGLVTTFTVQSSSVTTVMTVSLVNAGLLTLAQSAGLIMGANIGTTITAWIVAGLGFRINIQSIVLPLIAIGVLLIFRNNPKRKYWGEFIIGFGLLLLGMGFLNTLVPDINSNERLMDWFQRYTATGFNSRLLFFLIGLVITMILQSSTAAVALTLTLCLKGWIPYELGASMILGENLGTTITAELAALVGNLEAKRSARIHTFFNLIGVIWMLAFMPYFLRLVEMLMIWWPGVGSPFEKDEYTPYGLAAFHSIFNLTNALLLVGFIDYLIKLSIWSISGKSDMAEKAGRMMVSGLTLTPELTTEEIKKEVAQYGKIIMRMSEFTRSLINSVLKKDQNRLYKKLLKYENISDRIEIEITKVITQIAGKETTARTSIRLRSLMKICNEMERIADIYKQIANELNRKNQNKIWFSPDQRTSLNAMCDLIDESFNEMVYNLDSLEFEKVKKDKAKMIKRKISQQQEEVRTAYMKLTDLSEMNIQGTLIYYNIITMLDNIGNHILNITESVVGEI